MSEILATSPALPDEAPTVEGRLADIIETADVRIDEYRLSDSDRAKVVAALRRAATPAAIEMAGSVVGHQCAYKRMLERNWSIERAVETPNLRNRQGRQPLPSPSPEGEVAMLREALEPFAKMATDFEHEQIATSEKYNLPPRLSDDADVACNFAVKLGDCRRARTALSRLDLPRPLPTPGSAVSGTERAAMRELYDAILAAPTPALSSEGEGTKPAPDSLLYKSPLEAESLREWVEKQWRTTPTPESSAITTGDQSAENDGKLLPCPFCGSKAVMVTFRTSEDSESARVECSDCGAQSDTTDDAYADTLTAASLWNRRTPPSNAGAVVQARRAMREEAVKAIEKYFEQSHWTVSLADTIRAIPDVKEE